MSLTYQETKPSARWTDRFICSLSTYTEMITGQADCYIPAAIKPNSLATVDAVSYQLLAIGAGFDPRPI